MDAPGVIVEYVEAKMWRGASGAIVTGIYCASPYAVIKRPATCDAWFPIVSPKYKAIYRCLRLSSCCLSMVISFAWQVSASQMLLWFVVRSAHNASRLLPGQC